MTHDLPYAVSPGSWGGSSEFRLMPTDDFTRGGSEVSVSAAANGTAVLLAYAWTHAQDGPQSGTLLIGRPTEDGSVTAAWVDSWHQPDLATLSGRGDTTGCVVGYEYAPGWRWEIELHGGAGAPALTMRNAVPESPERAAVVYDVMRTDWS